jgi:hypothetical protein
MDVAARMPTGFLKDAKRYATAKIGMGQLGVPHCQIGLEGYEWRFFSNAKAPF